jgi:predicted DNA-binding transcriptional regulator AlpA
MHAETSTFSYSENLNCQLHRTLTVFDKLPDAAYVALPVVCALFSCSPSTVWRRVQSGQLISPHRIGNRTTRWNVGEIRAALTLIHDKG